MENFPSKDPNDIMDGWGWGVPTSDLENCYLSEEDEIRRRRCMTVLTISMDRAFKFYSLS